MMLVVDHIFNAIKIRKQNMKVQEQCEDHINKCGSNVSNDLQEKLFTTDHEEKCVLEIHSDVRI